MRQHNDLGITLAVRHRVQNQADRQLVIVRKQHAFERICHALPLLIVRVVDITAMQVGMLDDTVSREVNLG